MKFTVVTLFPEIFSSFIDTSLIGKAVASGTLRVNFVNPRDFTHDKHHTVDDEPFGGGEGMVLKPEPYVAALESVQPDPVGTAPEAAPRPYRVMLTPDGEPLRQATLRQLAQKEHLVLVCGRYEGFDERIRDYVDYELSLGDFVLNGGEVAAMAVIDGVGRLIPGVIGNAASLEHESHEAGMLDYPHFTRPRVFRDSAVPDVLVGGNHEAIATWRQQQALERTKTRRPDLYDRLDPKVKLPPDPKKQARTEQVYIALLHHPVYDREGSVVTTALTNLDLHDISRSSRTYGLEGYFIVTPIESQQRLAEQIMSHWKDGHGTRYHDKRAQALALVQLAADLDGVVTAVSEQTGVEPLLVATSASWSGKTVAFDALLHEQAQKQRPLVLLLGTGWGLSTEIMDRADYILPPLRGPTTYNHLSVRSAAAILLDRLFGVSDQQ